MSLVPAALKPFHQEQFDITRKQVKELNTFTQQHLSVINQSVGRAEGSVFNHSYAHISPIGPWVISFGSLLVTTIDGWDDHSFKTNAGLVVSLAAMAATALHTGVIYWRNQRQTALAHERAQTAALIEQVLGQSNFLVASNRMAKQCLQEELALDTLAASYHVFATYMASLDPGLVPNLLVKSWAKVGAWIDLPDGDQNRANIAGVVRNEIVPTANFYAKQLNNQLIALGCAPPEVVVEMGEEN